MPHHVACSPPVGSAARSPSLPIGSRGSAASRLVTRMSGECSGAATGVALADRRGGDDTAASPFLRGPSRFSFSSSVNSRSLSGAAPRPPAAPIPVKAAQHVLVGFDAPRAAADTGAPAHPAGAASPGPRETKPSLLSLALSDLAPARSLSFGHSLDLLATPSPAAGFLLHQVRRGAVQLPWQQRLPRPTIASAASCARRSCQCYQACPAPPLLRPAPG
jgi:hypothetical protein